MAQEKKPYYSLLLSILREQLPGFSDGALKGLAQEITKKLRPPSAREKSRRKAIFVRNEHGAEFGPYQKLSVREDILYAQLPTGARKLGAVNGGMQIYTKFVKGGAKNKD